MKAAIDILCNFDIYLLELLHLLALLIFFFLVGIGLFFLGCSIVDKIRERRRKR